MKLILVAALVVLATLGACAEGDATADAGTDAPAGAEAAPFELDADPVQTNEVTMAKSYKFDPPVIEVEAGTDVTWTNEDDFPHNVHFLTVVDDTHDVPIGQSVEVTLDEAGEYYYECSLHPQMHGKVIVTQ